MGQELFQQETGRGHVGIHEPSDSSAGSEVWRAVRASPAPLYLCSLSPSREHGLGNNASHLFRAEQFTKCSRVYRGSHLHYRI